MADPSSQSSVLDRASQIGGPLPVPGSVLKIPFYEENIVSERFPEMNGRVRLRYPNIGDQLNIAEESQAHGNTGLARIIGHLKVCLETAPASWYRQEEGQAKPIVALERLYDSDLLVDLFTRWAEWRSSFRRDSSTTDITSGAVSK